MIRSIKELKGHPVKATDGVIGKVEDFLFDDRVWELRYLVVDTGGWLNSRKVLITPRHLVSPDPAIYDKDFPVTLTKQEIEDSPPLGHDEPISRKFEEAFALYHGVQPYWGGVKMVGGVITTPIHTPEQSSEHLRQLEEIEESHLRSANEVIGYRISATNGEIGKVEDFIIDSEKWQLITLAVNTGGWLSGKNVLINIEWIDSFDSTLSTASVDLTTDEIGMAPAFDPTIPINRDYLRQLCDYYGRPYDS